MKWGSQALSWGAVVVLARLLTPADYGLVGLATLYLGFVGILTEGGLGTSIIAKREMTEAEIKQLNTVAVLLGLTGALLTCAAAIPLGWYFKAPALPLVMVALSVNAVLSALRLVPVAALQREFRFRGLALVEGAQAVASTVVTLGLALAGARYWSLVVGGLAGTLAAAGVSRLLSPHGFSAPRIATLRRYYHFTRNVLIGRISWYVYTNADFIVAGRMLGTAALGAYTFAWNIASVPVEKVTALVTRVTPAFFSRLQSDRAALARMLLSVTEGLVFVTLPLTVGMAVVADDFVVAYLGPQWLEAVGPLRILAMYATLRSIVTLLPQVLTMLDDTRFLMFNGIATALVLPVGFVIGSRWGGTGIAAAWVVVYPLFVVPLYVRCFRAVALSPGAYLRAVWPATRGVLAMLAALLAIRAALPADLAPALRLVVQMIVGALVFLALGVLPMRHRLRDLYRLLRNRPGPAPTAAPATSA
ncbi:MAG: lipopolysaccharide biosynthesis protein [Gemmatimonadales bacterium]